MPGVVVVTQPPRTVTVTTPPSITLEDVLEGLAALDEFKPLTPGATIAVDASGLHRAFSVGLSVDALLATPTGARDGQRLLFRIEPRGHDLTFDTGFLFGIDAPAPDDLSSVDLFEFGCHYDATLDAFPVFGGNRFTL